MRSRLHSPLAFIVLTLWPVAAGVMFSRLDRVQAVIWTLLGGYMLLPPVVAIDLPMLPAMDKNTIAAVSALVGVAVLGTGAGAEAPRMPLWIKALLLLAVSAPMLTALANPEPLTVGSNFRPGMTPYDGITGAMGAVLELTPFVLGYLVLSSPAALRSWLAALVLAGFAYAWPMLLEIRLSPQLNVWIYGFFAHDFGQMMRYGGFRPMVFLSHGLWVALFACMAVLAAAVRLRDPAVRRPGRGARAALLVFLLVVLVLCKSMAALIYALLLVPLVLLAPVRLQFAVAALLAVVVLSYPLLRWVEVLPVRAITDLAYDISPERGQSFGFRMTNEDMLLARAAEKPWTGWGGWNRNHVVDPFTGRVATVTDGKWIVQMSSAGLLGFAWMFGLLSGSVLRAARAAWRRPSASDLPAAGLALILAANLVDLLPNATLTSLSWVCAGSLAGWAVRRQEAAGPASTPAATGRAAPLRVVLS